MRRVGGRIQQPADASATAELVAQLGSIGTLDADPLRVLWRQTLRCEPPRSFSRDLLRRMIAYRLQEGYFGSLGTDHRKLLDRFARGGAESKRRLNHGVTLVREYQNVQYEVVVVPGGYEWEGTIYTSLSAIARAITGTAWNGPRFFGLHGKGGLIKGRAGEVAGTSDGKHRSHQRGIRAFGREVGNEPTTDARHRATSDAGP